MSLPDSVFIDGTVSDENGRFDLPVAIKRGELLRISAVGYVTRFLPIASFTNDETIVLTADSHTLSELTVKGNLPHTQIKNDALVTLVQGSVLARSGTLMQLLEKIPNVMVSNDAIKVFGRGVPEIYVNGRKIRELDELQQISSSQVHSIDVVTNPGAQYDASVPAVIRIRTQKAIGEGFSISDRAYIRYNFKKFSVLNQLDVNYRKGGLDLSGMLDLHRTNTREESNDPIYMYLGQTVWKQDQYTMGNNPNEALNGRLSLNYTFSPTQALGVRYDFMRRDYAPWRGYMESTLYKDGEFYDYTYDDDYVVFPESRHSVNAYYKGKLGRLDIDWNTDAFFRRRERNQTINEQYHDTEGVQEDLLIESLTDTRNKLVASKLVASLPLGSGTLAFGGEFAYSDQQNDFRNPQQIMQSNYSTLYERSWSVFTEYSVTLGKWNLLAGLRYENINSDYYQDHVRNKESSRNYSNLFPTLSLSVPIGNLQWSLRYSGGIKRPSYSQLRGSISYLGRYAYETGNPMLRPTLSTDISTSLSYQWLQAELSFSHYNDPVFYTSKMLNEEDLITYVYYENAPAYNCLAASVHAHPVIGIWQPQFGVGVYKQWIDMETPFGPLKLDTPYWTFTWQNSIQLPKGWLINVNMQLETKGYQKSAYLFMNNFLMNASVIKNFAGDRFSLQLDGNNILNTYQADPCRQYCGKNIILDLGRVKMSSVTLTARYKFNVSASKYKGTGAGQSQRSRM
ncbi:MAG: TonB-dependent receptor [Bacteroidaceae bacterium]|nr:TonB-dependent receptor [Bacteroidaceae bacterium]